MRVKIYLLILVSFSVLNAAFAIEDEELFQPVEIKDGSSIGVLECVAAAFKNNPNIRKQKYNLDVAKSNLGMAKAQYFPVINAGVGFYNENNSDNIYYNSHYRELPNVGVSINKLIWNFGKTTSYIKMEEFYKIGAEYEFMDCLCSTLFNVKAKYYKRLKEKSLLQLSELNVKLSENIVNLSVNKADLLNAKTNLAKAKILLNKQEKEYNNSKIDLNNSMYFTENADYDIQNTLTFPYNNDFTADTTKSDIKPFIPQVFGFDTSNAVEIAYENSPDLQVLIAERNAMKESLSYIKKTYLPDLTGEVGYGFNKIIPASNNSVYAGVNLTSSVNIMELRHNIKGADAQIKIADEEINSFKKELYFELKRAFNNVNKSEEKIKIALIEIENAMQTYNEVLEKYKSSELDYISLQSAKYDYINAAGEYINSLYEYNIALIQVEMAMHCHIADIHHKSEHAVHYHSGELIEHLNKVLDCDENH